MLRIASLAVAGALLLAVACSSSSGGGAGGDGATGTAGGAGGEVDVEGPCGTYTDADGCDSDPNGSCSWGTLLHAEDATTCTYEALDERCVWITQAYLATGLDTGSSGSSGKPPCHVLLEGGVHYVRETPSGFDLWGTKGDIPPVGSGPFSSSPDWEKCEEGSPALCTCVCPSERL